MFSLTFLIYLQIHLFWSYIVRCNLQGPSVNSDMFFQCNKIRNVVWVLYTTNYITTI